MMLPRGRLFLRPFAFRRVFLRPVVLAGGTVAMLVLGGSELMRDVRGATDMSPNTSTPAAADAVDAITGSRRSDQTPVARLGFRPRLGRHVVHAVVTVERDGQLLTFQVDRGTVASIERGTLTISEAGGSTVTVATNEQTRVRRDRTRIPLADLKAGDEVYVISRVPSGGGETVALRIAAPKDKPAGG